LQTVRELETETDIKRKQPVLTTMTEQLSNNNCYYITKLLYHKIGGCEDVF